jgi:integrase/recombinase XerD
MSEGHKTYLQPQDVDLLERQASSLRDRLLIRVLFCTGCRISEALGLTLRDVDFEEGALTIQHLKARISLSCPNCGARLARCHAFCPACGRGVDTPRVKERERRRVRTIPLDEETLGMLRDYVDRGGPVLRDGKRVIFGIGRSRAWQVIRECADKAGLEGLVNPETGKRRGVSPHRLRDAFAVMAVQHDDSTDSIRMLQEQLGHASIATTMRYRKVASQELKQWYQSLWRKHSGV